MIVELICAPLILAIKGFISLLPILQLPANSIVSAVNLIMTGLNFFPVETWIMCLGCVSFWFSINLSVGIYRFIKNLIPLM